MASSLGSLEVHGFRSIKHLRLDLTSDVTLLVGANGSGKSNVVDAFELLGRIVDGKVQSHLLRRGGFASQLHRSAQGADAHEIWLEAWGDVEDSRKGPVRNGYRATLQPTDADEAVLRETVYHHGVDRYPEPYDTDLGWARESRLRSTVNEHQARRYLVDALAGCRVFHFDDTSGDAPPLRKASVADNLTLRDDAANIAPLLLGMRERQPMNYRRIVRAVRNVAPFFDDFVLRPVADHVQLRWQEKGLDAVFNGSALSSGTLRFLCLATLLLQPEPPATVVLDEPELGLHPFAIHQLADLMKTAGRERRIVAATQSVTLLGQFTVDDVAIVERSGGATTTRRTSAEDLAVWLDDYSMGELWEMNVLGGRPQASARGAEAE